MDAERIRRQMQEVAVGNYRAFISAADALHAVREEVSSVDKHLDSLVIFTLPCRNFGNCFDFGLLIVVLASCDLKVYIGL